MECGTALRSMRSVHLSGYVCSMTASIHEISKFSPGWICFDPQGKITHINDNRSDLYGPEIKVIVENIHSAAPSLGFGECISSVSFFNKLIAINSSSIDLPLQQSNIQIEDDMYGRFDSGIVNKKSRQAIIDTLLRPSQTLLCQSVSESISESVTLFKFLQFFWRFSLKKKLLLTT